MDPKGHPMTVNSLSRKDARKRAEPMSLAFELLSGAQVGQIKPADTLAMPIRYKELKLSRIPLGASKQTSGKRLIKKKILKYVPESHRQRIKLRIQVL